MSQFPLTLTVYFFIKMPKGSYIRTKEIKEKMRLSHLGKIQSKETVEKRRQKMLGHTFNKGKKYPNRKKPKPFSEIHRKNLSLSSLGKPKLSKREKPAWNSNKKLPQYSGENSSRWIRDRSKLKKSENKMNDCAYKVWMSKVKTKDNWKCKLLSSDCKGRLESHHIFNWVDYPTLRYVISNGITLCAFHHPRGREEEKRMIPILQELLSVSEVQN